MDADAFTDMLVKVVKEELGTDNVDMKDIQARNVVIGTGWFGLLMMMNKNHFPDNSIEKELREVAKRIKEQFPKT